MKLDMSGVTVGDDFPVNPPGLYRATFISHEYKKTKPEHEHETFVLSFQLEGLPGKPRKFIPHKENCLWVLASVLVAFGEDEEDILVDDYELDFEQFYGTDVVVHLTVTPDKKYNNIDKVHHISFEGDIIDTEVDEDEPKAKGKRKGFKEKKAKFK